MSNDDTNITPDDLTPPDDFGAEVLAEFERRTKTTAAPLDGEVPGGWPDGAVADAAKHSTFDVAAAAEKLNRETIEASGESVPPSDASSGTEQTAGAPDDSGEASTADSDADATEQKSDDAGTATTEPSAGGDGEPPAEGSAPVTAPSGYTWRDGDQEHTFTEDEVRQGLILNNWVSQLPPQVREAYALIERGEAVPIARSDFDKFQAWQRSQEQATRDADLANLDVDPDVAKLIAGLRDEVAALKAGQTSPATSQDTYQNLDANLTNTANAIDTATRAYAQTRGLTDEQADQLLTSATQSGHVRLIAQDLAPKNPLTGQVLAPPPWSEVVNRALDLALIRNPELHSAVINRQKNGTTTPERKATPDDTAVTAKKARAASVASAPSATTPPAPRNPSSLTTQERITAMERELAAAMGRPT